MIRGAGTVGLERREKLPGIFREMAHSTLLKSSNVANNNCG